MESEIENRLVRRTKEHNGLCIKLAILGKRNFPDRTLLLPEGYIIFVETKDYDKELTKSQHWYSKILIRLGFRYRRINSMKQIDILFKEYQHYLNLIKQRD